MGVSLEEFLTNVRVIKNLKPTYRQPGDGSDGTCDCIGLVIGAIRRSGGKWTGIHGTNYAIRKEVEDISPINSLADLHIGDVVFKYNDDSKGLPARYKKGGSYYNGDLRDYYHVGVVTSLDPFYIVHMTLPTVKVDTRIGQWAVRGRLKKVDYDVQSPKDSNGGIEVMTALYEARVSTSGGTLNLRSSTNKSSSVISQIPNGTVLSIYDDSTDMYKTSYKNKVGYVSKDFLKKIDNSTGGQSGIFIPLPNNMIDTVLEALKKAVSQ